MKTELQKMFNMKHFFKVVQSTENKIVYNLNKPSLMLMKNIHINWLKYMHTKTYRQMPVYVNGSFQKSKSAPSVYGTIKQNIQNYNESTKLEHSLCNNQVHKANLQLDVVVPQQDSMQYFIKWQRYRKYWWSSISTTPSLFSVNDIKYEDETATADIVANFACGQQPVETVTIRNTENETSSCLVCKMSLECALLTLLLDGYTNKTKEEYLRLDRKIAPYNISFAINFTDSSHEENMKSLAYLLNYKLGLRKISSWLPDFSLSYEEQIKENLYMGVTYTAVLNESTLQNGIFKLMNSSTMLGEQVHVADFDKYAALLFDK